MNTQPKLTRKGAAMDNKAQAFLAQWGRHVPVLDELPCGSELDELSELVEVEEALKSATRHTGWYDGWGD